MITLSLLGNFGSIFQNTELRHPNPYIKIQSFSGDMPLVQ